MKRNTTKKALLASVLSIALSLTMLLGTTFAWFTDEVSTGNNIIKSGTLDVEMYHVTKDGEVNVGENADYKIFNYDRWEPGYTQVETIKITNEGNLAFKFNIIPNIPTETSKDDETGVSIADVIDVYVYPGESTATSWENVRDTWAYVGNLASVLADPDGIAWGVILPVDENGEALDGVLEEGAEKAAWLSVGEDVYSFALHMREEAGNEYQNQILGDLYLTLAAKQFTYEEDSFDHLYDEMAGEDDWIYVYTGEQLDTALELNYDAKIKVMRDINLVGCAMITNKMVLDLNGYTVRDELDSMSLWVQSTGDLTITGNGKWIKDHGANMFYADGALTIMDGYYAYKAYEYGTNCGHAGAAHCGNPQKLGSLIVGRKGTQYNGVVKIYGGTFDSGVLNPEAVTEKSFTDGANGSDDNMYPIFNSHEGQKFELTIYNAVVYNADPASGDANGPVLFLEGQTERDVVPEGYTIIKETPTTGDDLRTYYIVKYNK